MYSVIIPVCLFLFGVQTSRAQSTILEIQKWDNNNKIIDLNSFRKITFSNNDLVLNYLIKVPESIAKSDIRKLFFSEATGIKSIVTDTKLITVYPNPANDFITLKNIPEGRCLVSIYSITGSKITSLYVSGDDQQINVSNFSKGLYLLKVNNQVSKFIKQ